MSALSDIIQAAIARCRKINDDQQGNVTEVQREFNSNIGKPWKFRAEAIKEALKTVEDNESSQTPTPDQS